MRARPAIGDHAKVHQPRDDDHHPHPPWAIFLGVLQVVIAVIVARYQLAPAGYLLLLTGPTILLFLHRRHPALSVVGVLATTLGFLALGYPFGPVVPSTIVAFIGAVTRGRRVAAWLALFGLWLGWLGLGFLPGQDFPQLFDALRWLGGAALLAGAAEMIENRRQRRIVYRQLWAEERRRREEEEQRRAGEQRLRIARELHDVLAHSLSLINVRSSVALELMDTNPAEVREALLAIKQASKSGLDEVRSVLHGLRGEASSESAPRTPAPDLSRLDELVAQSKAAGLTVTLSRTGRGAQVPAAVGLAGYRIIQEALTNVIRHSQARTAIVHIHQADWALLIGVSDAGPARVPSGDPDGNGSGLIGIHERAASLGGWGSTGPDRNGGFTVEVALPLTGGRQ